MEPTPPTSSAASVTPTAQGQKPAWLHKRVGRYQIIAILGEGSYGKVFRAEDLQLARHVALKVIPLGSKSGRTPATILTAVSEARLAAGLEHPHIVHVYEVNQTTNLCYIAMELVEGGNLKDLVAASGPMDPVRACQLIAEAAEALAYAHAHGVIHRDVKPANLMLSRSGRCKLADFGLAVLQSSKSSDEGHVPPSAGTPQFMPPEIIKREPASPQSDIYSLGASLWYLLVGTPPFVAETAADLLMKHLQEPLPKLAKLRPGIPESLVKVISKALEKDPAARFESADQFASVLRVHTIPVGATASSMLGIASLDTPARVRKSLLWGGLAAVASTLLMVGLVYWWFTREVWHSTGRVSTGVRAVAPSRAAPAPVAVTASITLPAGNVYSALDTAALTKLADPAATTTQPANVVVEGIVASNLVSKHAKYFRISFAGADEEHGFSCVYKPELLPALQKKFTSGDGLGLSGHSIRVIGKVEIYKDRPSIRIESADQINLAQTQPGTQEN